MSERTGYPHGVPCWTTCLVRDLAEQSVSRLRQRRQEAVKTQAAQAVEDIILDALIPPMKAPARDGSGNGRSNLGFGIG